LNRADRNRASIIQCPPRGSVLRNRVLVHFVGLAVLVGVTSACLMAADEAPARPLLTATPVRVAAVAPPPSTVPPVLTVVREVTVGAQMTSTVIAAGSPTMTRAVAAATSSPSTAPTQARPAPRYTVQPGDSLSTLSRRFGVPPNDLATANGIAPDAGLRTGEALSLPAGVWSDRQAIRVLQPEPGTRVRAPVVVRGSAATFEGLVVVEALDASAARLAQVSAKAASPDTGLHGPFEATLNLPPSATDRAVTIRLYWPSPRDGSPSDEIRIPVTVSGT